MPRAQREPGLWGELTLKADKAALVQRRHTSMDAKARASQAQRTRLSAHCLHLTPACRPQSAREAAARARAAEAKDAQRAAAEAAEWEEERVRRDTLAARKAAELDAERGAVAAWQRGGAGEAPASAPADEESDSSDEEVAAAPRREPPPMQPQQPRGPLPPLRATTRVEVTLTELQKPNLPARAPLAEEIKVRCCAACHLERVSAVL